MRNEPRERHRFDAGMRQQKPCYLCCTVGMRPHAEWQRRKTAQNKPCVERAEHASSMHADASANSFNGVAPARQNASQRIAVSTEILC